MPISTFVDLNAVLARAVELGASDIHLKVAQPPVLRRDGELGVLPEHPPLTELDLEAALGVVTETDQWAWEPRLLWLKGCVAAESRESAKAEECFRRSLEIARSQGGRTDELRAAKSLADPAFTAS